MGKAKRANQVARQLTKRTMHMKTSGTGEHPTNEHAGEQHEGVDDEHDQVVGPGKEPG